MDVMTVEIDKEFNKKELGEILLNYIKGIEEQIDRFYSYEICRIKDIVSFFDEKSREYLSVIPIANAELFGLSEHHVFYYDIFERKITKESKNKFLFLMNEFFVEKEKSKDILVVNNLKHDIIFRDYDVRGLHFWRGEEITSGKITSFIFDSSFFKDAFGFKIDGMHPLHQKRFSESFEKKELINLQKIIEDVDQERLKLQSPQNTNSFLAI